MHHITTHSLFPCVDWHSPFFFMCFADLTERSIQDCVRMGISADFSASSVSVGGGVKSDKCDGITNKETGMFYLSDLTPCHKTSFYRNKEGRKSTWRPIVKVNMIFFSRIYDLRRHRENITNRTKMFSFL